MYHKILQLFEDYPHVLYGISDLSYSPYQRNYSGVLLFAVPHTSKMTMQNYNEETLESYLRQAQETSGKIMKRLICLCRENQVDCKEPPRAQSSEETLTAPLSFKYAATRAGLGWIGKNDVLITEKYGPRVRLSALLIRCSYPDHTPILESKCPAGCSLCVDACPHHALTGHTWQFDSPRAERIDVQRCNRKRSEYLKSHLRKHSCGFCMVACPIGQ